MPHKQWLPGEHVVSTDFNPNVADQVVAVFANAAARDANWASYGGAIPTGAVAYLQDVAQLTLYNGTAWAPLGAAARSWTMLGDINLAADGPILFTGIPQTYTHLQLVATLHGGASSTTDTAIIYVNGDTAATAYFNSELHAYGTSVAGGSGAASYINLGACSGGAAARLSSHRLLLPDYTKVADHIGTGHYYCAEAATGYQGVLGWCWIPTTKQAITQLDLRVATGGSPTWKAGSRATLLGIR